METTDFGCGDDIRFSRAGCAGIIHLNRPNALNALNDEMVSAFSNALKAWEKDDAVHCVLVTGEGRAFCAGGDVVGVYKAGKQGKPAYKFFGDEYRLNAYLGRFEKPCVSFLNGIVMGGGAGISVHGSHRIVTENTIFAMPETMIGFFCDVGAGFFLPRMANNFGLYLALTGERMKWGDCLQTGIATHAVSEKDLPVLEQAIIDCGDPRPALEKVAVEPDFETPAEIRDLINECFGGASIEECLERLQAKAQSGNEFASKTLETLASRSPTSLKVIFRQMTACKPLGLDDCMRAEYRIMRRMLDGHDFYEGVRAQLIDKDKKPVWNPLTLADVSDAEIDTYFGNINEELSL